MEKSDRSMLDRKVASAKRIATDMIPSITAKPFSTCFLKMHFHKNSAKKHHLFRMTSSNQNSPYSKKEEEYGVAHAWLYNARNLIEKDKKKWDEIQQTLKPKTT